MIGSSPSTTTVSLQWQDPTRPRVRTGFGSSAVSGPYVDLDSPGHFARPRDSDGQFARYPPQISVANVRCYGHHALLIVPVIFAGHGPIAQIGHVTDQRPRSATRYRRHRVQVLDRAHSRLRDFYLHLIGSPACWVSPVIRLDESAGGGRRG